MIGHPKIPHYPYTTRKFKKLLYKFKVVTNSNPVIFLSDVLIILKSFNKKDLIDYSVIDSINLLFRVTHNDSNISIIFKESILKELLMYNLYHTVESLENQIIHLINPPSTPQ